MSKPLDMMGREIKQGDTIAYGLTIGMSANLAIYTVDKVVPVIHEDDVYDSSLGRWVQDGTHTTFKLKATKLHQSYHCPEGKSVTLAMLERVLVINETAATWRKK